MAFTFTLAQTDPVTGLAQYTYSCDTSSAATTLNCGFVPSRVEVIDVANNNRYFWQKGMAAGYYGKMTASAQSFTPSNGFTPLSANDSPANVPGITFGTGIHVNSSTGSISLWR